MNEMTIASFFSTVGDTVTGIVSQGVNVFTGLWSSGPAGQVACSLGIAGTLIGFGMTVFRIGKFRRAK